MKTLTLHGLSDALHHKLAARAAANDRSPEEEAALCLQLALEEDEAALAAISPARWKQVEQSLTESLHDSVSDLTSLDLARYRKLARGRDAR